MVRSRICSGVHAEQCLSGVLLMSGAMLSPPVQPFRVLVKEHLIALLVCGQSCAQHFASCGWVQRLCRVKAAHICFLAIAYRMTVGFSVCGMLLTLLMQVQRGDPQHIWSSSGRSQLMQGHAQCPAAPLWWLQLEHKPVTGRLWTPGLFTHCQALSCRGLDSKHQCAGMRDAATIMLTLHDACWVRGLTLTGFATPCPSCPSSAVSKSGRDCPPELDDGLWPRPEVANGCPIIAEKFKSQIGSPCWRLTYNCRPNIDQSPLLIIAYYVITVGLSLLTIIRDSACLCYGMSLQLADCACNLAIGSGTCCTPSSATGWLHRGQHCCAAMTRSKAAPLQGNRQAGHSAQSSSCMRIPADTMREQLLGCCTAI